MTIEQFEGKYRFLSNFGPGSIQWQDKFFQTAEHLYQARKTNDPEEQEFVRVAPTPNEAKRRGKKVTMRQDWDAVKDGVMKEILRLKFQQNPELAQQLIATGSEDLVEGNWWGDTYWGKCFGSGQNKLGIFLQEIREEVRSS